MLTNANLLANAQQMLAHMHAILGPGQIVFNPLPMFHSFGLTAAALAPLLGGVKVVLYPSPLHYRQIPKAVQASKATVHDRDRHLPRRLCARRRARAAR